MRRHCDVIHRRVTLAHNTFAYIKLIFMIHGADGLCRLKPSEQIIRKIKINNAKYNFRGY